MATEIRRESLGDYYDLQVQYTLNGNGSIYIEAGWYKKKANSSSYNSYDAYGSVSVNGLEVYNPTRIDFDMRNNSVGDFKTFWTGTASGKSAHVVVYFNANMSSGTVKSATIDWEITIQQDGAVYIWHNGEWRRA